MAPKKRRDASSASHESPQKKVKTEDGIAVSKIANIPIQFEWEMDGRKWTTFSSEQCDWLCNEYNNGKKQVIFKVPGIDDYEVSFDSSLQKNMNTGFERKLRLAVKSQNEVECSIWQYQAQNRRWTDFSIESTLELEKEFEKNTTDRKTLTLKMAENLSGEINVSCMEGTNLQTTKTFKIRRVKSDAVLAEKRQGDVQKSSSSSGKSRKKVSKVEEQLEEEKDATAKDQSPETNMKTIVIKGKASVDPECVSKVNTAHVYCEAGEPYDAMLNQTNVQFNNNKYFRLQVLEDDKAKRYSVWFHWGRVGKKGQHSLTDCGPALEQAKQLFLKKFSDKTANQWSNKKDFFKKSGKYDLVELDYSAEHTTDDVDAKKSDTKVPESKLHPKIQDILNLICDIKNMEDTLAEMQYDAKKAPLGKLTKAQIAAGYKALKEVEDCIKRNDFGHSLVAACNAFYTRIPHDFGMRTPPLIRTPQDVKAKNDMLEALSDIEVAMKIVHHKLTTENPLDTHYKDMHCNLQPMDKSDPSYKLLVDYMQKTHASTHNQYELEVLDIFQVEREGEDKSFLDFGNRMLLWHGSRLSNWLGILRQGLRVAPPEAPVTGYMFGKGIYFADMSSKSANYCYATLSKKVGLLLLAEVSLGQVNELVAADSKASDLPTNKHSVKGLGSIAPDKSTYHQLPNGTVTPCGKPVPTGVTNPSGFTLNYNEYIVYNPSQVKMRYLFKVQFNFRR